MSRARLWGLNRPGLYPPSVTKVSQIPPPPTATLSSSSARPGSASPTNVAIAASDAITNLQEHMLSPASSPVRSAHSASKTRVNGLMLETRGHGLWLRPDERSNVLTIVF